MYAKRILIAALLAAGFAVSAHAAGFAKTAEYADNQFADVPATEWYASEVKSTFELGLMKGEAEGVFNPNGNVTVAEAVTMASRAAAIYADETVDTNVAGEWYAPYVAYATAKGFVKEGQFDNYDRPATRKEVAVLFENAMPDGYFTAKNDVTKIPDVSDKQSYKDDLLTLYKAGVVMGSDSYGNFFPENNITRAEAAAIINRVALPENRLSKTLDKISDDDAYLLINTPEMPAVHEGINSGWLLDARGAVPRSTIDKVSGQLIDIDASAPTALIREINPTATGKIELETNLSVSGPDGIYLEFTSADGKPVYRLQTIDGNWQLLGADGAYQTVYEIGELERGFVFRIELDLDNKRSVTYIGDESCGVYPLSAEIGKGITAFRVGTTDEAVNVSVNVRSVRAYANYAVYDDFKYDTDRYDRFGKKPADYTGDGAFVTTEELAFPGGAISKSFVPVSGTVVAETMFYLPEESAGVKFALMSGEKTLAAFTASDSAFRIGDTLLSENTPHAMWHRLRLEANTDTQTVTVKINGKKVADVPFENAATSADRIVIESFGESLPEEIERAEREELLEAAPRFDNVKVFRLYERSDYVPTPVAPKGEDKYTVGMNVCSLWQNGISYGWSCITPYDDIQPVLGYYDEGNPETADWEIKYLVEHGIDFQAFCIFPDESDAPIKMEETPHLYDAFMNAKYSDMTHFAIIYEAAAGAKPKDMEAWKTYFVPYFIENYFKDPRYITVDNRPVMCVFGPGAISRALGSDAALKEAFDYLEEEVKKLGFDGMVYLACGSASDSMSAMGFDGCYAYNWGKEGCTFEHNRNSMLTSASNTAVYTVPTVSVGFNSIAWEGVRSPLISMDEYRAAHEWVRDEYLPTYAKEDWQQNFVMLSTWNEYGEGTYIMPTTDEKGFGYIDVIRETYTDEKASESVNTVPTDAQKTRINRLYPQYRRLLRKDGSYTVEVNESELVEVMRLNLDPKQGNGSTFWVSPNVTYSEKDGLTDVSHGPDPQIILPASLPNGLHLEDIQAIRLIADIPNGERFQIFFATEEDSAFSENKTINLRSDAGMLKEYLIPTSNIAKWQGTLNKIRLDPVETEAVPFQILSIQFLTTPDKVSKEMFINGNSFTMKFEPQKAENGAVLVAFDPALAMDFRLGLFHLWDKATGTLTLENPSHTVVYRVGSNTYTADGKEKPLGFTMTTIDGLPLIPIQSLCEEMGYPFKLTDNVVHIETYQKAYLDSIPASVFGSYEFNHPGENEGWTSETTTLLTSDGYLRADTFREGETDPVLWHKMEQPLAAAEYGKIEVRVRYRYDKEKTDSMQIFFVTDTDQGWNEAKSQKVKLEHTDSEGEWETYVFDMASVEGWKDNVTQIRFDPFNASGYMEIDYFRITK